MLPSPSRLQPTSPIWAPQSPVRGLERVPTQPRVAVLLNANAKKVNEKVRSQLAALVPEEDLFFSTSLEQAADMARTIVAQRYGTLLLGGGDGTIANTLNLVLNAAKEQSVGHRDFISRTLAELLSGAAPEPTGAGRHHIFSPFGLGVLDLALATIVESRAHEMGVGTRIPEFLPAPWTERAETHQVAM